MTESIRSPHVDTVGEAFREEQEAADEVLRSILAKWDRGGRPDASVALVQFPFLKRHSSAVITLIYEEYCRRAQRGECVEEADLCSRFPDFSTQIHRQFAVHNRLADPIAMLQDVPVDVWPTPGSLFLGYRIVDQIACGAIARVYLAREISTGERLVVLKVSRRGASEAEIMGRLEHPNIVPVLSVREDDSRDLTAVCMPFLSLSTLADVIETAFISHVPPSDVREITQVLFVKNSAILPDNPHRRLPSWLQRDAFTEGMARLGLQLAEALEYTHGRNVLHRDIKPSNVLITLDGRAMLLDFNLSTDAQSLASRVGGTLPYMSPEQTAEVAGIYTAHCVDARADVFSLGVVLFHAFTGQLPFGRPSDLPFSRDVATEWLATQQQIRPTLRQLNPRVDRNLASIIERCLRLAPQERPQSAAELVGLMKRSLRPVPRARRWMLAYPRKAWSSIACAATIAAATVLFAATREPAWKHQFRRGSDYFARGDFTAAAECFRQATNDPAAAATTRKAYAHALLRAGVLDSAMQEFRVAYAQTYDPQMAAGMGYCLQQLGLSKAAAQQYAEAIRMGFNTAATHNNLGVCLGQDKTADPANVLQQFELAESKDPTLSTPVLNRIRFRLDQAKRTGSRLERDAIVDANRLIQIGVPAGDGWSKIAAVHLLAGDESQVNREMVFNCLRKAIRDGVSPRDIAGDDSFRSLRNVVQFQELLRLTSSKASNTAAPRILDPFGEMHFDLEF